MDTNERITLFCCKRHPDESQDLRYLDIIITILNQVQNDANRGRHSDESASGRIEFLVLSFNM